MDLSLPYCSGWGEKFISLWSAQRGLAIGSETLSKVVDCNGSCDVSLICDVNGGWLKYKAASWAERLTDGLRSELDLW